MSGRRYDLALATVQRTGEKLAKADEQYSRGTKEAHCALCRGYAAHECQIIAGRIFPAMWCRNFDKRAQAK